ncbi:hypothetical protein EDB19DRAFT_1729746 [Suillus lakei]|nr:hypothetical protein EDB19DRAFT_1729746 [Suillus lakei]
MHSALPINDIAYLILETFRPSPSDLVYVAQTCRGLVDPALDILWSRMSSLALLIMYLPRDTWEVKHDTIHFTREPLPMEWASLVSNASRVRKLALNDDCDEHSTMPHASEHVLESLYLRIPPKSLFPGLCALEFETIAEQSELSSNFRLLRQFFSPRLEHLVFDVQQHVPTDEVERLVNALPWKHMTCVSLQYRRTRVPRPLESLRVSDNCKGFVALAIEGIDVGLTRRTIANIRRAQHQHTLIFALGGTSHDAGGMPIALPSLEHLDPVSLLRFLGTVHPFRLSNYDRTSIGPPYQVPRTRFPERNRRVDGILVHDMRDIRILERDLCGRPIAYGSRSW